MLACGTCSSDSRPSSPPTLRRSRSRLTACGASHSPGTFPMRRPRSSMRQSRSSMCKLSSVTGAFFSAPLPTLCCTTCTRSSRAASSTRTARAARMGTRMHTAQQQHERLGRRRGVGGGLSSAGGAASAAAGGAAGASGAAEHGFIYKPNLYRQGGTNSHLFPVCERWSAPVPSRSPRGDPDSLRLGPPLGSRLLSRRRRALRRRLLLGRRWRILRRCGRSPGGAAVAAAAATLLLAGG